MSMGEKRKMRVEVGSAEMSNRAIGHWREERGAAATPEEEIWVRAPSGLIE